MRFKGTKIMILGPGATDLPNIENYVEQHYTAFSELQVFATTLALDLDYFFRGPQIFFIIGYKLDRDFYDDARFPAPSSERVEVIQERLIHLLKKTLGTDLVIVVSHNQFIEHTEQDD